MGILFSLCLPWAWLIAYIDGEWIIFTGGLHGDHRIARNSDAHRVAAHWRGYVANNWKGT